ncbi:MAG: hypothetical protein AB7S99_19420 [Pseudodonghicola sp.]
MRFIDQPPAYNRKSLPLETAIALGRADLFMAEGSDRLAVCFRPRLEVANAFDRAIDARLKFNDLSTPEKLDLMIAELLPGFYHPEFLPLTGRTFWAVRFVVDGTVRRTLAMDAGGIRAIDDPRDGQDVVPAIELETDIMTLMAILRSFIAEFHRNPTPLPTIPDGMGRLADEAAAPILGGMAGAVSNNEDGDAFDAGDLGADPAAGRDRDLGAIEPGV